jgi:hypothetical protein
MSWMARSLFIVLLVVTNVGIARACTCAEPGPGPCRLLKEASAIFLGSVVDIENPPNQEPKVGDTGLSRYRFRVDEKFAGIKVTDVDIYSGRGGADCSYHFRPGEEYLVFAYKGEDGRLSTSICSRTQPAESAQILLKALRAARDGGKVPSLFGVLRREQAGNSAAEVEGYDRPLANTVVHLTSQGSDQFSTVTDERGAYAFYGLPAGSYRVSADLGSHLKMGDQTVELPARACYQHDLLTVPATQIQGHIVAPDGHLVSAAVELFLTDRYSMRRGWWEYSDGDKGFQFNGVAPGDYLLVFNNDNNVDPDAPFPRTFYPSAPDLVRAQRIHVTEDDEIINADLHVSNQRETRKLTVRLIWQGTKKPDDIIVSAHGNEGGEPFPQKISPELYQLTLLKNVGYEIHASQDCGRRETENASIPIGEIRSSSVVVEPDNPATEVTLVFPGGPCTPYNIPEPAPGPR